MKPRYKINETVRIKATGEKVKIDGDDRMQCFNIGQYNERNYSILNKGWYAESELKPYRPSRTGKFRNSKGQFMSQYNAFEELLKPVKAPDSKQRNYQKILMRLDEIENKIDKLNHETTYR